jgi:cobalt/nickel transport system permease protein
MARPEQALDAMRALDALAAHPGDLTRRAPLAHLLVTMAFIVCVLSFDRYTVAALLPLALFPTVLAAQARVPAALVARTVLLSMPFAVMVGLFNPWLDRSPMLELAGLPVSGGWVSLVSIVLRVALTVSATLVLVAGTGLPALCAALSSLGVPQVLTVQLLLLYRYLFVLAGETARMNTARQLRAGWQPRLALATYASMLGQLLLRSVGRAQRLHQAMQLRGYTGQWHQAARRWCRADTFFVLGWLSAFGLARALNLPSLVGQALMGALP